MSVVGTKLRMKYILCSWQAMGEYGMGKYAVGCLLAVLVCMGGQAEALRILSLVTTPSHSHHIFNRVLNLELARRGHHVTVLSADVEKEPPPGRNYRHLVVERSYEQVHETMNITDLIVSQNSIFGDMDLFFEWMRTCSEILINSKALRELASLAKEEAFDLVIYEVIGQEFLLGILKDLNYPPTVGISAFGHSTMTSWVTTSYENPSFMPAYLSDYHYPMTLWQKVETDLFNNLNHLIYNWIHLPKQMELGRKIFGDDMPDLTPILRNTSLILINENLARDEPRPIPPDVITIGGMHLQKSKPLPKDLQQWIDEAKEGVIFFALGSNVRSDQLPKETLDQFLKAFSKCKERILWKFETPMEVPKNIKISKWLPQRDILGHPNVKLFMSHGGGMSTNEAIFNGVPILVIPFFADQLRNAHLLTRKGMGETIHFSTTSSEEIFQKIRTLIDEPSYLRRAQELKAIYQDEPVQPLDKTIYWLEYVVRHKGAKHLRLVSRQMPWYQIVLLDVLAVYVAVLLALGFLVKLIARLLCRLFSAKDKTKLKKQ